MGDEALKPLRKRSKRQQRKYNREAKRRERERTKASFSAMREADKARCLDLAFLETQVRKEDSGCWEWLGPWRRTYARVRPVAKAGQYGEMQADRAVYQAIHGKPIPAHWFLGRRCGRVECVAPDHLILENRALRSARERRTSHGEAEELRERTGPDESGDHRRCG